MPDDGKTKKLSRVNVYRILIIVTACRSLCPMCECVCVCASALCVLCMQRALFVFQTDVINSICLSLGLQFHFGCYRCRAHSNRIRQAFKQKPPRKLEFLCTGQMKRNTRCRVHLYFGVGNRTKSGNSDLGSSRFHSFLAINHLKIVICECA